MNIKGVKLGAKPRVENPKYGDRIASIHKSLKAEESFMFKVVIGLIVK